MQKDHSDNIYKKIRQILKIDPGWELEYTKEQLKRIKIKHKTCRCGQQE